MLEAVRATNPRDREKRGTMRERVWRRRGAVIHDAGAATAEYAITIMAAVGFAGLLVVILKSGEVQAILTGLVRTALSVGG
jgi:hypothetical protein